MTGSLAFLAVCVILWAGVHAAGWLLIWAAPSTSTGRSAPVPSPRNDRQVHGRRR
jgi:hypothetical protein